ncbi:isoleucine--tRNA ligase [candidate division WOR-3 bacterium]|uniref:Isoleucine--tRNA ligase n=1 Tax=candidate division WOR-3 bacterium TaxID=2052148 RepID=A0A937XEV4_UNCW3|nr:isoleucine--tRNA ligase [candidate division WOR-3 bacterium]
MFTPVPRQPDHREIEPRILRFWEEHGIFGKLVSRNRGNPKFRFLDGPITANNPMGVHHAWGRTYKDLFQRYHAMLGHDQRYQNGFDCQGLWVEVEVEKELGFKSKRDIEKLGIDLFVEKCKERVLKYSRIQAAQSVRLGQWMDWENSYFTMSEENNYSIWHFLKRCHERGLVYEGTDVMPWCARCGTAISDQEIATEGYRELTHKAVFLRLRVTGSENEFLLVWTTTPWTLTSNVAAAVHPELEYVRARKDGDVYILAKPLLPVLGKGMEVIEELKGGKLVGLRYTGPFDELAPQQGVEHRVIPWDEVSAAEGTGIVHIAPGCGKEDFLLGKEHGLAVIAPLKEDGTFTEAFGWLSGMDAQSAARPVFDSLEKKGLLFQVEDYAHRYPVCWRCGQELVFRLVDEWFISMDSLREEIKESARQVRWIPDFGLARELDWLTNMSDWCISKKRYWGLALPIFRCECGWFDVIGSREELKTRAVAGWEQFDGNTPHRPWVDEIRVACGRCGKPAARIKDVGNPWLDAGIVPFSTIHYLTNHAYWQEWFPSEFITESFPGQFRNWFYAILTMSTVLEKRSPFRTILGYALMKGADGREMHKSWGNAVDTDEAFEKMGADVMRWVFCRHNPVQNLNFGYDLGDEVRRKFLTLWNVYSFFVTYANIDQWTPGSGLGTRSEAPDVSVMSRGLLDRWILSRLNSLVRLTRERLDDYDPSSAPRAVEEFIDDLSVWYVRRSRRRFWKPASDADKQAAYRTLYDCLVTLAKTIAPFMPFLAEELYQSLVQPGENGVAESVHLCPYPEPEAALIDLCLEKEVGVVRAVVSLGRAAREKTKLKVRQPLQAVLLRLNEPGEKEAILRHAETIKEELNVHDLLFGEKDAPFPADYAVEECPERAVGICTTLTAELENEGFARELVHKVQNLRKSAGFEVTDRIRLHCLASPRLTAAVKAFEDYIRRETLAVVVTDELPPESDVRKSTKINREPAELALKRVRE